MPADLSIIIVNYNERENLRRVLRLLATEFSASAEIIVVDNASGDDSVTMVREQFPAVHLIASQTNLMYGKGNNVGMAQASGRWFLIINADVEWEPGFLRVLVEQGKTIPQLGAAGPQVRFPDGRIQPTSHRRFPNALTVFIDYCLPLQQFFLRLPYHPYLQSIAKHHRDHATAAMTGVCLLIPRTTYEHIGGFDEAFTMYLEETDWQQRMAKAGLRREFIAGSVITHFGSAQKTYAQASRHYLWGLEHFAQKHWNSPAHQAWLQLALWTGTLISDIVLALLWLPSFLLGRVGRRLRHYTRAYLRLTYNLIRFPTSAPRQ